MEGSREQGGFTRAKLHRDLMFRGGTTWYAAAPQQIPEDVMEVKSPYGGTYPVLHLHLRECKDGTLTDQVEWEGVDAGRYIEDRAFLIVEVSGTRDEEGVEPEITDHEAAAPVSLLMRPGVVRVNPLGTMEARWKYHDGRIMPEREYDAFHSTDTVITTFKVPEKLDIVTDTEGNMQFRTRLSNRQQLLKMLQEALGMIEGG
jgi:hypothetical protein